MCHADDRTGNQLEKAMKVAYTPNSFHASCMMSQEWNVTDDMRIDKLSSMPRGVWKRLRVLAS